MIEKVIKSTCGLCQIGCGIFVHVDDNDHVAKIAGDPESPLNHGMLCSKGLASLEYLYHPDRLKHPLKRLGKRGDGKWATISWSEALDTVAEGLAKIKNKNGVESVAFVAGSFKGGFQGRYLQRFSNLFGSPNNIGQGHVCFVPRVNASKITYGFYAIPDFDYPPGSITVWGKNLPENLHHVEQRLAKAVKRGSKLMVINPRDIGGAGSADIWLKPRPGSDLALALGMINVIINHDWYDKAFVKEWTVGFDELRAHVRDYTPERVADLTWVSAEMITQAAKFYGLNKPACLQWGNAIDHGVNSFQTARALCILRAITGNLEIPGGDLRWLPPPVDTLAPGLTLPEKVPPEMRKRRITPMDRLLPIAPYSLPQDLIKAIRQGDPYPIRAVYVQGCNPLITYSNAQETRQAFLDLEFLAVTDMFMTPTAALADIVLPAATYLEYDGIVAPAYSIPVALIQQKVTRIGECRSDYEILRDLSKRMGFGEYFWENEEQCLDTILAASGLSFHEFRKTGALVGTKVYRHYRTQGFPTPSGKIELYSSQLKEWGHDPLPTYHEPPETPYSEPELAKEYPLLFTSGKRGCYRHSSGRQISSLRGSHPEPIVNIHPQTAEKLGIADKDWVYIETRRGRIKQRAILSTDIDPRVVDVDYAWWFPEDGPAALYGWAKSNVNILTADQPPFNLETGASNLRGMLCKVYKAEE
ncbi:MAG: molybdopterin-dependent oxidoreductase [Syntrophales bacterium]|jgi:anaerobic selenocysteine-containing dehydrogenase|nr:molybdopterin-dependent oxidoreductase [Syntrophales bacterium]